MTTILTIEVTCGNCAAKSQQAEMGSTNTMGAPDLDLRPAPMKRQTMALWLEECPNCKLVCPQIAKPPAGAKAALEQPDYVVLVGDKKVHDLVRKFRAWAYVAENVGMPDDAGFAHLHAAWIADDVKDKELADLQRHVAATHLAVARDRGTVYPRQKGAAEALLADIHRRMGRWDEAIHEAERGKSVTDQPFIDALCDYEIALAKKHDADVHTTKEVP